MQPLPNRLPCPSKLLHGGAYSASSQLIEPLWSNVKQRAPCLPIFDELARQAPGILLTQPDSPPPMWSAPPLQLPELWLPPLDLPGQAQGSLHRSVSQVRKQSAWTAAAGADGEVQTAVVQTALSDDLLDDNCSFAACPLARCSIRRCRRAWRRQPACARCRGRGRTVGTACRACSARLLAQHLLVSAAHALVAPSCAAAYTACCLKCF